MFYWRITKYNPKNRDSRGVYLVDEWTSYSDIGDTRGGKTLTYEEYETIENAYVAAILLFMECNGVENLKIVGLERRLAFDHGDTYVTKDMKIEFLRAADSLILDKKEVDLLARLILREKLWCKLESQDMFVHFGWDYYMYIGSAHTCEKYIKEIKETGLFVEKYESPYLFDEED